MKRKRGSRARGRLALLLTLMAAVFGILAAIAVAAVTQTSPSKVQQDTTALNWSGQGVSQNGSIKEECDPADPGAGGFQNGATADNYLLWIFSTDGGSVDGAPTLTVDGTPYGNAYFTGGVWQIVTPGPVPSAAYVSFTVDDPGNGAWILTISHGCTGGLQDKEHLTVSKTVETSFDREHFWDITKEVATENEYTHNDLPKIWLYANGTGNETATWTVGVTYEGYTDSNWNVKGTITVENDGGVDAEITGVTDNLAGTGIDVDCGVTFPYILVAGDTLECTYDEDVTGKIEGNNVGTATTTVDEYSDTQLIEWGDPANETNKTITVTDSIEGELGTVTAPDSKTFTYSHDYAFADYPACGDFRYDNTASIEETGQSASASLLVNVQCYLTASAWAKGTGTGVLEARCFSSDGFSNWGWTNKIGTTGTYTWTLWAGAAMCDTSKGFNAGTVTFTYNTGTGLVTGISYNFNAGVIGSDLALYSGCAKYPKLAGKDTTAPGQYKNSGCKTTAWVIAHAKVKYPDPAFGP